MHTHRQRRRRISIRRSASSN